jgi:hypothetical protein
MKYFYPVNSFEQKKSYVFTNYIPNVTSKINNRLRKYDLQPISSNKRDLSSFLVNNKERRDKLFKSGIYQINCKDCNAIYLGQTGRSLKKRVSEHAKSIFNNKINSGFAEHCISNNHSLDVNNIQLLHSQNKGKRLDLLEIIEIKKAVKENKNITNDQIDFVISPIIQAVV